MLFKHGRYLMHHEKKPLSYGKLQKYLNARVTKVNILNMNFKGKMKLHFL